MPEKNPSKTVFRKLNWFGSKASSSKKHRKHKFTLSESDIQDFCSQIEATRLHDILHENTASGTVGSILDGSLYTPKSSSSSCSTPMNILKESIDSQFYLSASHEHLQSTPTLDHETIGSISSYGRFTVTSDKPIRKKKRAFSFEFQALGGIHTLDLKQYRKELEKHKPITSADLPSLVDRSSLESSNSQLYVDSYFDPSFSSPLQTGVRRDMSMSSTTEYPVANSFPFSDLVDLTCENIDNTESGGSDPSINMTENFKIASSKAIDHAPENNEEYLDSGIMHATKKNMGLSSFMSICSIVSKTITTKSGRKFFVIAEPDALNKDEKRGRYSPSATKEDKIDKDSVIADNTYLMGRFTISRRP